MEVVLVVAVGLELEGAGKREATVTEGSKGWPRRGGIRGAPWRGLLAAAAGTYNTVLGETLPLSITKTLTLQKTIVAKHLAGPDCANTGTLTSNGCNLDSDITCQLTPPSDKPNVTSPPR